MVRNPSSFLREEYRRLVEKSLDWRIRVLESASKPRAIVNGKSMLMLCSNNYLNLAAHPRLIEAMKKATEQYGAGSGSVRPIAGTMKIHVQLEEKLAEFKRREAALYYQTGFATNAGLIPQLVDKEDAIFTDELNHGSIIDGCRLTKAERFIYPHNDISALESALNEADKKGFRRLLIITDGVFSMDGDIAKVPEICKVSEKFGAMVYIDDAHGEGVLGEDGRGIGTHFHLEDKIDIEMGTFSKAFGVVGGHITGSRDLINFAYNKSRTWLLSGSAPPATVAACIEALNVLETEPHHVKNLWENTKYFKKSLQQLGFDTGVSETPITPVMLGESSIAKKFADMLFEKNVFVTPIVFPMVPQGKARIRTIMNAGFTRTDLDEALSAFENVGKRLKII